MTTDLLYRIFEQHLYNALVEDETTDEFLTRVVLDYLGRISSEGMISRQHIDSIEQDLKEEVLEMLRKKTYGHFSLAEFRKAKAKSQEAPPAATHAREPKEKGRRSRRPC